MWFPPCFALLFPTASLSYCFLLSLAANADQLVIDRHRKLGIASVAKSAGISRLTPTLLCYSSRLHGA